nr:7TM GPCR domain containing protein [Haemonchus contortus]
MSSGEDGNVFDVIADYFLWFLRICSGVFNLIVAILLIKKRALLQKPYYWLILIFNTSIVILDGFMVVFRILINLLKHSFFTDIHELAYFATSIVLYFTSCLVFLIGLNRMAIFVNGKFHDKFSKRKTILICAFIAFITSVTAAACSSDIMKIVFVIPTSDSKEISSCMFSDRHIEDFFASLYLVTCGLFIATAMKLRKQGGDVVSRNTRMMLGKAERSMLRQSYFILTCALINVVIRILRQFGAIDMLPYKQQHLIVSTAYDLSHIGIPLIVILSSDFRQQFREKFSELHSQIRSVSRVWGFTM